MILSVGGKNMSLPEVLDNLRSEHLDSSIESDQRLIGKVLRQELLLHKENPKEKSDELIE